MKTLRAAGAELAVGVSDAPSPLRYAITPDHSAVLAWLLAEGCDPEAAEDSGPTPLMEAVMAGAVDAVRLLLDAGACADRTDEDGDQAIAEAQDLEIVRLLLAHGADLNAVNDEMRLALFGIQGGDALDLPPEVYLAGKEPRFGTANPEMMAVPFWHAMVRGREPAYTARRRFGDTESWGDAPVWCFQRFGRTPTALPLGRYVEIAGEHEDFYDPDFCIYNDVVVYHGDSTFTLYGYPEEVFPPTDFHTATLVGTSIYLIGSLGYQGQRHPGETPVYRLDCKSWRIEPVVARRGTPPAWINRHTAAYDAERNRIVVSGGQRILGSPSGEEHLDNTDTYALDLGTQTWQRLPA